jgi:hypothetical protein
MLYVYILWRGWKRGRTGRTGREQEEHRVLAELKRKLLRVPQSPVVGVPSAERHM